MLNSYVAMSVITRGSLIFPANRTVSIFRRHGSIWVLGPHWITRFSCHPKRSRPNGNPLAKQIPKIVGEWRLNFFACFESLSLVIAGEIRISDASINFNFPDIYHHQKPCLMQGIRNTYKWDHGKEVLRAVPSHVWWHRRVIHKKKSVIPWTYHSYFPSYLPKNKHLVASIWWFP